MVYGNEAQLLDGLTLRKTTHLLEQTGRGADCCTLLLDITGLFGSKIHKTSQMDGQRRGVMTP
jgi:hypothetical protein